jgi:HSP20 family protein
MVFGADPFRDIRRLQEEMNRLFESAPAARGPEFPAVNVYANQDGAVITAELPGVRSEDLELSVHRDSVTLSGDPHGETEEGAGYHRRERQSGRFVRTLSLPFLIDPNSVEAGMRDGLLTLKVERAEEDKPRRITVKAS